MKRLRANKLIRRMVFGWIKGRDVRIPSGAGKGLCFNAGHSNPAYTLGTNEIPVQKAFAKILRPGMVFFDIGANVGYFSVIAARLVGETGKVYAFEPVPENADILQHNIQLNNFANVNIYQKAVSNSPGVGELLLAEFSGGSALAHGDTPPDLKDSISVELVSIDSVVYEENFKPPSMIKIDVEGAEIEVLLGMQRTMKEYQPVILYEIDDRLQEGFERKQHVCDAILTSNGYQISRLEDSYQDSGWIVGHFLAIPKSD